MNEPGEVCTVRCVSGADGVYKLYSLKPGRNGCSFKEVWKTNPLTSPVQVFFYLHTNGTLVIIWNNYPQGLYSMSLIADGTHTNQFVYPFFFFGSKKRAHMLLYVCV